MDKRRRKVMKFLLAGAGAGALAGVWWARTSSHRAARVIRMLAADLLRPIPAAPFRPQPGQWSDHRITLSWLGHATVLINFYGVRILTDPVFSDRVGVGVGPGNLGPKRHQAPALAFGDLPPVDLVLLSHAHFDHMDLPTLRRFPANTPAVTAKLTQDILADTPLKTAIELGWNERRRLQTPRGELEIEALQVRHWGRRWPSDLDRGYNGYVVHREGKKLLFAGDTAMTSLFAEHRAKGPFEVGIMPIAAYNPWIRNHCTPEEAVQMADLAGARHVLPVHHETFKLSDEPMEEPIARFAAALAREPERIALKRAGETFVCPAG